MEESRYSESPLSCANSSAPHFSDSLNPHKQPAEWVLARAPLCRGGNRLRPAQADSPSGWTPNQGEALFFSTGSLPESGQITDIRGTSGGCCCFMNSKTPSVVIQPHASPQGRHWFYRIRSGLSNSAKEARHTGRKVSF